MNSKKIGGAAAANSSGTRYTKGTRSISANSRGNSVGSSMNSNRGSSNRGSSNRESSNRKVTTLSLKNRFNPKLRHSVKSNKNTLFMRPPVLRRVITDSRDSLHDLLEDVQYRNQLVTNIRILLKNMKYPTKIMVLDHIYKEEKQDFYVNFDNGSHLSIHYNRNYGGEKGHIHISDKSTGVTIRIAMFFDDITGLNVIGMCYNDQEHADLKFLAKVCSKSIKRLLETNTSKKYNIKKICTSNEAP
jgi:hypothetical protein